MRIDKTNQIFIILILLLFHVSCNKTIEGFKLEGNFKEGKHNNELISSIYTDPKSMFSINIPSDWDTQEDFSESLYGVFFMDTLSFAESFENFKSISITKFHANKNLKRSFVNEILMLRNDKNETILRIGKEKIRGNQSFWILTNSSFQDDNFYNLTYYLQKGRSQELFLLKATIYETDNYLETLTELHDYLKTFVLTN